MYEAMSFAALLARMLDRVPDTMDKREGSVIYDALAPAALELANAYVQMDYVLAQAFGDTADRAHLIRHAAERNIRPQPASAAILRARFNTDVPIGSRFNCDDLNFTATEQEAEGVYRLTCETAGAIGNTRRGRLIPIQYIDGLTTGTLEDLLIPGEDAESTESLRTRYLNSFDAQAFGGNIADYREKIGALPGVGGVHVIPVERGGGTVGLVILAADHSVPTPELVAAVQEAVDPYPQGTGLGIAPIDHAVEVRAAGAVPVNIGLHLSYRAGYDWSSVEAAVTQAVRAYLQELRAGWEAAEETGLIVRISQIETRLLAIDGILDLADTTLCGVAANLVIAPDNVPVLGEVTDGSAN